MFRLTANRGPECPDRNCGCNDCTVIHEPNPEGWFDRMGRARCNFCGNVFGFTMEPETESPPIENQSPPPQSTREEPPEEPRKHTRSRFACPECGAKGLVRSTRKGIQYRKCVECSHNYKTEKVG